MLTIKQLEKATDILKEIKLLDQDIINIEKSAFQAANGNVKINLNIGILDLNKQQEEHNKVQFDEDGSLVQGSEFMNEFVNSIRSRSGYPIMMVSNPNWSGKPLPKPEQYYQELSENDALKIFQVLLQAKINQRNELISKLNKLQVTV